MGRPFAVFDLPQSEYWAMVGWLAAEHGIEAPEVAPSGFVHLDSDLVAGDVSAAERFRCG
jgi:hypothetical protein